MRRGALAFLLAAAAIAAASPASAACREDLIKADQNIHRTRSDLQKATSAAPAAKCAAYRRHVASLGNVRNVFARCDTSTAKAQNAAAAGAAVTAFTQLMNESCKR